MDEDEEEGEAAGEGGASEAREEWLARIAAVGRGDCIVSMTLLTQLLAQKKGELEQLRLTGLIPLPVLPTTASSRVSPFKTTSKK